MHASITTAHIKQFNFKYVMATMWNEQISVRASVVCNDVFEFQNVYWHFLPWQIIWMSTYVTNVAYFLKFPTFVLNKYIYYSSSEREVRLIFPDNNDDIYDGFNFNKFERG